MEASKESNQGVDPPDVTAATGGLVYLSEAIRVQARKTLTVVGGYRLVAEDGHFGISFALKYSSPSVATEKLEQLHRLEELRVNQLQRTGTNPSVGTSTPLAQAGQPEAATTSQWLDIDAQEYIPVSFNNLLDDISKTGLKNFTVDADDIALAKGYLDLFDETHLIKADLLAWRNPEDVVTDAVADFELKTAAAHDALHQFLKIFVNECTKGPSHEITINNDFSIIIDDKVATDLKERDKKTILLLAYFGSDSPFDVDDFCDKYGVGKSAAPKDFYRILGQLKEILPHVHYESDGGNRVVMGVNFLSTPAKQEILKAPVLAPRTK